MNVKQQIKEYKRELILDAAAKLFYEKGFQKTTIDDIGAALGVTKPFIYTYFENKYAILEQLFDQSFEELYVDVLKVLNSKQGSPKDRLRQLITVYVEKNIERQRFTAIMLEEEKNLSSKKISDIRRKQRDFDTKLARLIEEGVEAGQFRVSDPMIASLAISGMVRWTHRWYSPQGRLSASELATRLSDLALNLVGCAQA
ncbi:MULTISPECIES: TetR/AcrR family transcriptional regulator [Bradyrhizobium]|uniref:TetR/AcrR family transcriptional regulator n=1 Tax=Bradyrhizobium TaxID=374 RepID=UPI00067F46FB|nr:MULTISPECIES: TetR/AcrR family transcriptional regulator [Bradyrhizobium]PAY07403.1 TetR/AcrR family transcriptional regulator [Bradyrhizobium sp. UFLA03-84]